jgi:hypothetical protein
MKLALCFLVLLMPGMVFAQNYQGMNEADMRKMMQQMGQLQACMEKIDQEAIGELEERANQAEAEIESLCEAGKRDEARKKAIAYGKEFVNDPTLVELRKCGEMAQNMVPEMPYTDDEEGYDDQHVCDR